MNRLINNKKMGQNEALASAIVELSDKELEMVVGGGGGDFACPAHHDDDRDCHRDHDYDHRRRTCGCDDSGFSDHFRADDLVTDLLGLLSV